MSAAIDTVAFDCENAARLAQFWSQVLGAPVDADPSGDFASIGLAEGAAGRPGLVFNKVPDGKQRGVRTAVPGHVSSRPGTGHAAPA